MLLTCRLAECPVEKPWQESAGIWLHEAGMIPVRDPDPHWRPANTPSSRRMSPVTRGAAPRGWNPGAGPSTRCPRQSRPRTVRRVNRGRRRAPPERCWSPAASAGAVRLASSPHDHRRVVKMLSMRSAGSDEGPVPAVMGRGGLGTGLGGRHAINNEQRIGIIGLHHPGRPSGCAPPARGPRQRVGLARISARRCRTAPALRPGSGGVCRQ